MFSLRRGYFVSGIVTGLMLVFSLLATLPDGKLHIVFCDVGQGDAAYIRFADGRDMLVDGGPNNKILQCLGNHMPFWDRTINMVLLTHPQRDHLQGLITVLDRYSVDYVVRSDVDNTTEGFRELLDIIKKKHIPVKLVTRGETIAVGATALSILWPSREQIALFKRHSLASQESVLQNSVLGSQSQPDLNDGSIVFTLGYGSFDALFPGDADTRVEENYRSAKLADDILEVLKVPHHGSRTGMSEDFIKKLHPRLAVVSVGKNSYGHPNADIINNLALTGSRLLRTDQEGDIEVVSDGGSWEVKARK